VYDIWNTPAVVAPFYGKPKPQKATIRKTSALSALELPGSEASYNPLEEDVQKVTKAVQEKLKKIQEKERRLQNLLFPSKPRTAAEIIESLPAPKKNQLTKIKKNRKKTKASKPYQSVDDKHYSTKMTRTERNKQTRRRAQLTFEKNHKLLKKRHRDMENAEKYADAAKEADKEAKKRRELELVRRKFEKYRTKHLRQRYMGIPNSALVRKVIGGSFRGLRSTGREFMERTARFEQRNMVVA